MALSAFRFGHLVQDMQYRTLRPKGSGDYLLIYTLDGKGRIDWGRNTLELGKGDLLLYTPGAYQSYRTAPGCERWELAWAHFEPRSHWLPLLKWPEWAAGVAWLQMSDQRAREELESAFQQILAQARQPWSSSLAFALNHLEACLLWADLVARKDRSLQVDSRLRRAMDFLIEDPGAAFSLDAVAAVAGLSPSRFSHLFKAQTGQTPQRFSEEIRLAHARFLLKESRFSIAEIARQCGYGDALYFSRRFQHKTGESPSAFRRYGSMNASGLSE